MHPDILDGKIVEDFTARKADSRRAKIIAVCMFVELKIFLVLRVRNIFQKYISNIFQNKAIIRLCFRALENNKWRRLIPVFLQRLNELFQLSEFSA